MNGPLTADDLARFCPGAAHHIDGLNAACLFAEINTPRRIAYFMAQTAEESRGFTKSHEIFDYTPEALLATFPREITADQAHTLGRHDGEAYVPVNRQIMIANLVYANRLGNGDVSSGDGNRYRGRGPIEVTGRDNYTLLSQVIGTDYVSHPELLEKDPDYGLSAGWFWNANRLNAFADAADFVGLTKAINGGLTGLAARQGQLARAVLIWPETE